MEGQNLIDELILSTNDEKQKKILSIFKQSYTSKKLKAEVDRQIQEELDET